MEKKSLIIPVLRLSVGSRYQEINNLASNLMALIHSGNELDKHINIFKKWQDRLNYHPENIKAKQAIVDELYKHKKYYID